MGVAASHNGGVLRILLVEDDPTDAALFKALLGHNAGFEHFHADSLAAAFELVDHHAVDLIVLDLGLPDSPMDSTYVRMRDRVPDVAVIVLTGHDDDETALQALADGAQDFLVKNDVTEALLARTIRYSIERHRAVLGQRRQRSQELEVYASLVPEGGPTSNEPPVAVRDPEALDRAALTYGHLLDDTVARGFSANHAEVAVTLEALAAELADAGATPPDLAAVHAAALSRRQGALDAAEFARHEDAARLLLLRFTGELANRYRSAAHQGTAIGDRQVDENPDAESDPDAPLPRDVRERLADALASLLGDHPLDTISLADVAAAAGLSAAAVARVVPSMREPLVTLIHQELTRQRDLAELLLAPAAFAALDPLVATERCVGVFVELWSAGRIVIRATLGAAGDETVADLRLGHLRTLADRALDALGPSLVTTADGQRRRAELALAELFAVLDQKLVLGELFPRDEGREAAVRDLAERFAERLPLTGEPRPSAAGRTPDSSASQDDAPEDDAPEDDAPGTDAEVAAALAVATASVEPTDSVTAGYRRLTEQDYAAWADRMRSRRRSEIDSLYEDGTS